MTALEMDRSTVKVATPHAGGKSSAVGVPFYRKLYVQVLIAVALGAALGYLAPAFSVNPRGCHPPGPAPSWRPLTAPSA